MESSAKIEARRQRLFEKASKSNKKSTRLLKKVEREIRKPNPEMTKVLTWQRKSAKLIEKGLRYLGEGKTLGKRGYSQAETEVAFNMEEVSARYVKTFGATSCVFRATMAEEPETMKTIRVRDILANSTRCLAVP